MRARARWGITPLLAAPAYGWALGLGDIELQSALNQPFRAQIALSATPEELEGLRVMLAAPDTFTRYGLDRPGFLNNFEFRIVADRNGRNVIQVTSRESVVEPFVTLLLEATWPRGRTLREYTVLLDPPVLLPAPAAPPAIAPAETRTPSSSSGGAITRPAAPPAAPAPAPTPAPSVREPAGISNATPPPSPRPSAAEGGTYGPVQRAETLWAIADRLRPDGITVNQMMIAIFEANPEAFGGNINILRAGATLRLPEQADFASLATTVANAEVRRQTDEWQNRTAQGGQLRLLPPTEPDVARAPAPAEAAPATPPPPAAEPAPAPQADADAAVAAAAAEESRRLLELRNAELERLQEQAAAAEPEAVPAPEAEVADPGVELESEQLFTDETEPAPEPVAEAEPEPVAAPAPAPATAAPVAAEPSLVSQAMGWLMSPLLWIAAGVAVVLLSALLFVRRRKQESEDVTGRWEALEQEIDDDPETRDATERMRRQVPEQTIVVEEQHAQQLRPAPAEEPPRRAAATRQQQPKAAPAADETLSSQTVINLDQADAVAEADFHIAYGLYDQAAELVQKALEAAPDRRDLKLKLLEVYFMWGNKEAFLKAAHGLRADLSSADDPDWNKVVIMGRQICPDERLFTDAPSGGGRVDVDLEAGDSPLDLAFDEASDSADVGLAAAGLDLDLEASDERPAPKAAKPAPKPDLGDDALDIGARTAAGLEAALFEAEEEDEDDSGRTTPDLPVDSLAVTQESPTVERPSHSDWATVESESPTAEFNAESPTVETPTIESPAARSTAETVATKTVAIQRRAEAPTVEQPAIGGGTGDYTAEIDLDDLGLDVKDIEGLPSDLGDLPMAAGGETDTREQPALREDDALLSATGVTKVLHEDDFTAAHTAVLEDDDATQLAPGFGDATSTLTGTEVLEGRFEDDESGNTSLVRALRGAKKDDAVDLDLADLTAALHGADTVEQPRSSSFSNDVFGGGDTPLDLDIGSDSAPADDDPTGTEEVGLDPQTMTEVGTKLDLARAYIDMGDPEGARSILEEVLDEGDSTQRREAQGLIDALSA